VTRTLVAVAALLTSAAILAVGAAPTSATVSCNRFAATNGSDSAAGTSVAPYRTAQKLMDSLAAGETGCLGPGTYNESLRVNHGGQPGAPVRLTSTPGGQATVVGRLYVPQGSNDVVVSDLALDGRNTGNLPSPTVTPTASPSFATTSPTVTPESASRSDRSTGAQHTTSSSTGTAFTTAGDCRTARPTTTTASTSSLPAAP